MKLEKSYPFLKGLTNKNSIDINKIKSIKNKQFKLDNFIYIIPVENKEELNEILKQNLELKNIKLNFNQLKEIETYNNIKYINKKIPVLATNKGIIYKIQNHKRKFSIVNLLKSNLKTLEIIKILCFIIWFFIKNKNIIKDIDFYTEHFSFNLSDIYFNNNNLFINKRKRSD